MMKESSRSVRNRQAGMRSGQDLMLYPPTHSIALPLVPRGKEDVTESQFGAGSVLGYHNSNLLTGQSNSSPALGVGARAKIIPEFWMH